MLFDLAKSYAKKIANEAAALEARDEYKSATELYERQLQEWSAEHAKPRGRRSASMSEVGQASEKRDRWQAKRELRELRSEQQRLDLHAGAMHVFYAAQDWRAISMPVGGDDAERVLFDRRAAEKAIDRLQDMTRRNWRIGPGGTLERLFTDDTEKTFVTRIIRAVAIAGGINPDSKAKPWWQEDGLTMRILSEPLQGLMLSQNLLGVKLRGDSEEGRGCRV